MRRSTWGCRRRSGPAGSGRRAGCHHRRWRGRRSRPRGGACRSRTARRSRCGVRRGMGCERLPGGWGERRRRSRASCGGMPRRAAADWSIEPPRLSGTPNGRRGVRSGRSWPPTRRCGRMCRTGLPVPSSLRAGPRFLVRRWPGRGAGTGSGSTGAGRVRGARSRSPGGCGSTSPAMRRCGSATRPSTRRSTCRAAARCGAS